MTHHDPILRRTDPVYLGPLTPAQEVRGLLAGADEDVRARTVAAFERSHSGLIGLVLG